MRVLLFLQFNFNFRQNTDNPSHRSLAVIAGVLGRAGESGQKRRLEAAKNGQLTWEMDQASLRFISDTARMRRAERHENRFSESSTSATQSRRDEEHDEEAVLLGLEEAPDEVSEEDMLEMLAQAQEKAIAGLDDDEETGTPAERRAKRIAKAKEQREAAEARKLGKGLEGGSADNAKVHKHQPSQAEIDAFWSDNLWIDGTEVWRRETVYEEENGETSQDMLAQPMEDSNIGNEGKETAQGGVTPEHKTRDTEGVDSEAEAGQSNEEIVTAESQALASNNPHEVAIEDDDNLLSSVEQPTNETQTTASEESTGEPMESAAQQQSSQSVETLAPGSTQDAKHSAHTAPESTQDAQQSSQTTKATTEEQSSQAPEGTAEEPSQASKEDDPEKPSTS